MEFGIAQDRLRTVQAAKTPQQSPLFCVASLPQPFLLVTHKQLFQCVKHLLNVRGPVLMMFKYAYHFFSQKHTRQSHQPLRRPLIEFSLPDDIFFQLLFHNLLHLILALADELLCVELLLAFLRLLDFELVQLLLLDKFHELVVDRKRVCG